MVTQCRRFIIRKQHFTLAKSRTTGRVSQLTQKVAAWGQRSSHNKARAKVATGVSYVAIFALIVSFISLGYRSPIDQQTAAAQALTRASIEVSKPSVDQLVAANMASTMAETANLPIATNVANLWISLEAKGELAQTDDSVISKPQIVQPTAGSREIREYKAKAGDTVDKVARQFDVSADTVRWANDLTSDAIEKDKVLRIPAVDGIIYTAKAGDTAESLAEKYQANAERIILYNDLELSGLAEGDQIVIPNGVLPEEERPGYEAPQAPQSSGGEASGGYAQPSVDSGFAFASVGNRYDYGYCTWYVYERRAAIGKPIGSFWGNATSWASFAASAGFTVNNTPAPGAIFQSSGGWGGYGHVAFVESVAPNGDVTLSEMNYAGWNVVSSRTLSASQAAAYNYIH